MRKTAPGLIGLCAFVVFASSGCGDDDSASPPPCEGDQRGCFCGEAYDDELSSCAAASFPVAQCCQENDECYCLATGCWLDSFVDGRCYCGNLYMMLAGDTPVDQCPDVAGQSCCSTPGGDNVGFCRCTEEDACSNGLTPVAGCAVADTLSCHPFATEVDSCR